MLQVGPGEHRKFSPNLAISKALPATGFHDDHDMMMAPVDAINKTKNTRFPHCDCIQLGYSVHAVAKVRSHFN